MFDDYQVMIRINCEGIEDEVIYSAYEHFGSKLSLILGSLDDVKKIKGDSALRRAEQFIADRQLPFEKFHSNMSSWVSGLIAITSIFRL